jgi:hypothetical protein
MAMKPETTTPWFPADAQAMWSLNAGWMESARKAYATWLEDCWRVRDESLQFLGTRMARNMEAAAGLAGCSNPAEAFELQMKFGIDAFADCVEEGRKIAGLLGRWSPAGMMQTAAHGRAKAAD